MANGMKTYEDYRVAVSVADRGEKMINHAHAWLTWHMARREDIQRWLALVQYRTIRIVPTPTYSEF